MYLIAQGDNGRTGIKVGCGDSAIPVTRVLPFTTAPLTAAIKELLSIKEQFYGQSGLYNALYQSNLAVESVALVGTRATIRLTGTVVLGGTCDSPRFSEQIRLTALQFSTVRQVAVFINGVPMEQVLSQK